VTIEGDMNVMSRYECYSKEVENENKTQLVEGDEKTRPSSSEEK